MAPSLKRGTGDIASRATLAACAESQVEPDTDAILFRNARRYINPSLQIRGQPDARQIRLKLDSRHQTAFRITENSHGGTRSPAVGAASSSRHSYQQELKRIEHLRYVSLDCRSPTNTDEHSAIRSSVSGPSGISGPPVQIAHTVEGFNFLMSDTRLALYSSAASTSTPAAVIRLALVRENNKNKVLSQKQFQQIKAHCAVELRAAGFLIAPAPFGALLPPQSPLFRRFCRPIFARQPRHRLPK